MTTKERTDLHQDLSNKCHSVECKSRMLTLWQDHLTLAHSEGWDGAVKTYERKIQRLKTSRAVKKTLIAVGEEKLARYFYIKNF